MLNLTLKRLLPKLQLPSQSYPPSRPLPEQSGISALSTPMPTMALPSASGARRCRACGAEFPVAREVYRKPHTCPECLDQAMIGRHNPIAPGLTGIEGMGI
jgi:hypothetical protein